MNSLPTILQDVPPEVIEQQWDIFKKMLVASNLNLDTLNEIAGALLRITDSGGYGKLYISVVGGLIQEIRIEQTRRVEKFIIQTQETLLHN